ncbi:MAG: PEP-CTERM sorting domain-containing protein [Roseateles sp.]|uniref:PEP-CTERM sorting domain-containing protein n=1 Tax=Roseateles sp. TaxID=1971397 RepID=UPI004035C7F2
MQIQKILATASLLVLTATSAVAAPVVYNLSLPNISTFDSVITGTGASVLTAQVTAASSYNYVDLGGNPATVTVTRTSNGALATTSGGYSSNGQSLSGNVWNINPSAGLGGAAGGKPDINGYTSGLTFTFSSPVNAFGFEIGDWATCCMGGTRSAAVQSAYGVAATGSGLWIAFDGGAATLPANALSANDNPGYAAARSYTNFIGAIDSSGTFSKVTFFGDGFGEFLVAGGTLRFASVAIGSVGNLPEPASLALVGLALGGVALARRRKSA